MTFQRFLSFVLSLLMASPPLMAAESVSSSKPSVAIVEVKMPDEFATQGAEARAHFWKSFSDSQKVRLIPRNDIETWRARKRVIGSADHSKEKLSEARELLTRGKKAYNQLDFQKALSYLEEARRLFIMNLHTLRNNRDLIDAHLYLGTTFVALKKLDRSHDEFRRVVYLDPKRELSSRDFSPKVMTEFAKVRQEVMAPDPVKVRIDSSPTGGIVYLNGRASGITPLEMTLQPGEYFILVEKEGMLPWYQPVELSRRLQNLQVRLKSSSDDLQWVNFFRIREGADEQSEDLQVVNDLAQAIGAQMVLLAEVKKEAEYRLFAQLWDVRTAESSKVVVQNLGKDLGDLRETVADVSSELLKQIQPNGYVIPAKGVEQGSALKDLTVGGADRPKQDLFTTPVPEKAWYQKWWIWPIIGAVGVGVFFGAKSLSGSNQSGTIVINNKGNF